MPRVMKQNSLPFVEKKKVLSRLHKEKNVNSAESVVSNTCLTSIENVLSPNKKRGLRYSEGDEVSSPSKKICSPMKVRTPTSALTKLQLDSPSNLVLDKNKSRNCAKELFPLAGFQQARKAFYSSTPSVLPGREIQLQRLRDFIFRHLKEKTSGSMYVSGPPGTGKSACLNSILKDSEVSYNILLVITVHISYYSVNNLIFIYCFR